VISPSKRRKPKWDPQPTASAGVLLASDGRHAFSRRAVARAAALAGEDRVAVLTIAKIYGTSLGLPHPGLLPTKEEMTERVGWVDQAVHRLEKEGIEADGQVASARRATRTIVKVARLRGVHAVVMDETLARGLRRLVEGDAADGVVRALRRVGIDVEIVPAAERIQR
jgi:nucleotide-binding universal stress UspA family protein